MSNPRSEATNYDEELSRIDASIADLKNREIQYAAERSQLEAKIQAAKLQRDILAHDNSKMTARKLSKKRKKKKVKRPRARAEERKLNGLFGLIHLMSALLPSNLRGRYIEEWRGELYDMRMEGAPWRNCVIQVVVIALQAVPRLAVTLRQAVRKTVD